MATTKSSLGQAGASVPKPGNQGSSAPSRITPNSTSKGAPGGFMSPVAGKSKRIAPKSTTPRGGSGTGSHRGDRLPR